MFEFILLGTILVLGFATVQTENLLRTVIFSGSFSLLMALAYLYYNAPDVALAEAAIGVGLSTVIYLVSLKKIRVYDIVYINRDIELFDDRHINSIKDSIVRPLEKYIEETVEIEPQITYTDKSVEKLLETDDHDFIIVRKDDLTYLYGYTDDQVFQDIVANMNEVLKDVKDVRIVYRDQEVRTNE